MRQHRIVEHQPVDVDRGEAEVLAEDPHAERVVREDVDLPDLAVPPRGPQGLETEGDVVAGERVQHDVDAFASRGLHQVIVPVVAVRIERPAHAHLEQLLALAPVAGGRVDLRPDVVRQRDRRLSDAAHRGVDEDPLPLSQPRQMDERVVRGHGHGEGRRSLLHAQPGRLEEGQVLVHDDSVGDAAPRRDGHLVPGAQTLHVRAGAAYDTAPLDADLAAQRRALVGQRGEEPQRDHDIPKVQSRRGHLDLDVGGSQTGQCRCRHLQAAHLAGVVQPEPVGGISARGHERPAIPNAHDARYPQASVPDSQFPLARVARVESRQRLEVARRAQIHETEVDLRVLGEKLERQAAYGSPQRASSRRLHAANGALRHNVQATSPVRALEPEGREGLEEGDEAPHRSFARRIVRGRPDEEIDRLEVRAPRPLFQRCEITVLECAPGDAIRSGRIELRDPLRGRAPGFADHPAGSGGAGRNRSRAGRRGIFLRSLQERCAGAGVKRAPAVPRLDDVALLMRDERESPGHGQPLEKRPRFGPAIPARSAFVRVTVQKNDLGRGGS